MTDRYIDVIILSYIDVYLYTYTGDFSFYRQWINENKYDKKIDMSSSLCNI
jgi:hypothetical protein